MRKISKVIVPLLLFGGVLATSASIFASKPRLLVEAENQVAFLGETINVEKRSLSKGGQVKEAVCKIYTPSEVAFTADKFVTEEAGIYKVVYYAYFGSEEVSETVSYLVKRKGADIFSCSGSVSGEYAKYSHALKTDTTSIGVRFDFSAGSYITYNKLIDVEDLTSEKAFIEYIVDCEETGVADFKTLKIKLIDSENENNYVEIIGTDSGLVDTEGAGSYFRAGVKGSVYAGWEGNYEARVGRWHYTNYGQTLGSSFRALPKSNPSTFAKLFLDYNSKTVYGYPRLYAGNKAFINDLDSPELYASNPWMGFNSGKCYLQISCSDLVNAKAHLLIKSIGGVDLTEEILEDTTSPVINIDYAGNSSSAIPKAVVGKPYKVFDANVIDDFDNDLPYTRVVKYFDYTNNKYYDVSCSKLGYFTPKNIGTYVVIYNAHDRSGNVAKTIKINVMAAASVSNITFALDDLEDSFIYDKIALPVLDGVTVKGGSGNKTVTRTVKDPKGQIVEVIDNIFYPQVLGTYQIIYEAYDYIGNYGTQTQTLNVKGLSAPKFLTYSSIAPVLIKDFTYEVAKPTAVETYQGEVLDTPVEVLINGQELKNGKFVASGETVNVQYKATGKSGTSKIEFDIDVVDGGNGTKQDNYFYTNASKQLRENDVYMTSSSDATAIFANALSCADLGLYFAMLDSLTSLDIILSDSIDSDLTVTFNITKTAKGATLTYGENSVEFAIRSGEMFLGYKNGSRAITDASNEIIGYVKTDDLGREFNGFGDTVYACFSFKNVSSSSSLAVTKINNQPFGHQGDPSSVADEIKPQIVYESRLEIEQNIGDTFACPKIRAFDVLSEVEETTIKVTSPKGVKKFESDGQNPQTFTIDEFGGYTVAFTASDTNSNSSKQSKKVFVYDNVNPTLSVDKLEKTTYSVGDEVALPSYKASDNSSNVKVDVILILPNNEMRNLIHEENGEKTYLLTNVNYYPTSFRVDKDHFRTEYKGKHTLRYVAYDDEFNKTVVELTFEVK